MKALVLLIAASGLALAMAQTKSDDKACGSCPTSQVVAQEAKASGQCAKTQANSEKAFLAEAEAMKLAAEGKTACCKSTTQKPMAKGDKGCCNAKNEPAKFKVFVASEGYRFFGCKGSAEQGRQSLASSGKRVGAVQKVTAPRSI